MLKKLILIASALSAMSVPVFIGMLYWTDPQLFDPDTAKRGDWFPIKVQANQSRLLPGQSRLSNDSERISMEYGKPTTGYLDKESIEAFGSLEKSEYEPAGRSGYFVRFRIKQPDYGNTPDKPVSWHQINDLIADCNQQNISPENWYKPIYLVTPDGEPRVDTNVFNLISSIITMGEKTPYFEEIPVGSIEDQAMKIACHTAYPDELFFDRTLERKEMETIDKKMLRH